MIVQIKVFIQPTLNPCAKEAITTMYEAAKRNIENDYKDMEIEIKCWSINSADSAREKTGSMSSWDSVY